MNDIAKEITKKLRKLYAEKFNSNLLNAYGRERLLYRLSLSRYKKHFCLKGGSFIYALERDLSRPTKDIDLLGSGIANNQESLKDIFEEICNIECLEDGIVFDTVSTEIIIKEGKYDGIRIKVKATLGTSKLNCAVDVGFGDIVIKQHQLAYPTLLEELNPPLLDAYSVESVVAEKFQAMLYLGERNS